MKKVLVYLFLTPLLLMMTLLLVLSIPYVTKAGIEKALTHFLEVNATVDTATLSIHGLNAAGTLNHTDTFVLQAKPDSYNNITVTLHYDGDVNTFSKVATVKLPYIKTTLDAHFRTEELTLDLNASLLEGTLLADLSLMDWRYNYQINHVDITSFQTQQKPSLDNYASGQLTAYGSGIIEDPYTVLFHLKSEHLQLENNVTSLISPQLQSPLPLALEINGSVGSDNLKSTLTMQSTLIDAKLSKLFYDFNQSTFNLTLALHNHQTEIAPLNNAFLDFNGSLGDELNATYLLTVDDYRLESERLQVDLDSSDVTMDYRLSSLKQQPLNLQGENTLFGDLRYGNNNLSVKIDSKAINSPVLLALKKNQLHIISNNINIEALQILTNQKVIAKGDLFLEADANLSSEPLLWKVKAKSKDLQLPWKYRKDIGLRNPLALTIKAKNDKEGNIIIHPALWSNVGVISYTGLRYNPDHEILFFNLNAKKVKTSYYQVPRLNLKGALNLKKRRLNKTVLTTPYERVVIKNLHYSDKGVKTDIAFMLSHLDRFGSLNPEYTLHGQTHVNYTPPSTHITLDSKELGHLDLEQKEDLLKLSGDHLPVEQINTLFEQPMIMRGDLDYTLRYSASSIKAAVHAKQLRGDGDFNTTVRPFALDFSTALKYKKSRYHGSATLKTDNESFKISNIIVDLSQKKFQGRYKLEIAKLENNTFILPKELKGPLHVNGTFKQDKYQYVTLDLVKFQLPLEWHKILEANATSYLETDASISMYNNKGDINFDADITNALLRLSLSKSDYNLKTGDFHLHTDLQTDLWLKDTNITAEGSYKKTYLAIREAEVNTANETVGLHNLQYVFQDENLTTRYKLRLKPYPNAPYHSKATIYGDVKTKPELYATMQSESLGGAFNAYVTNTDLHLNAKNVSMVKLIKFTGQKVPITSGRLDAEIDMHSPRLLDGNLSTIRGRSDINISAMTLKGVELDDLLETLRNSQDLNLFQGSLGDLPIVRSVKELPNNITKKDSNSTRFSKIRFLTDVNATGLHCSDCAIATEENLIAIKGGIDLEHQTFNEMYVGMLFPNNCAYFIQQVEGNLSEPQVKLAAAGFHVIGGATKSLIGNVGTVLDFGADVVKGTGQVVGNTASYVPIVGEKTDKALTSVTDAPKNISTKATKCIPFYSGAIKHPKPIIKSRRNQQNVTP